MIEIVIAIIGALSVIVAAWITVKYRGRSNEKSEHVYGDIVGGDKVVGDVVGRDKNESHEHIYVDAEKSERKNAFVYFLEVLFVFVFTCAIAGALFGGIGFAIAKEVGAAVGGGLALIAGLVNAGNVKRTKGIT